MFHKAQGQTDVKNAQDYTVLNSRFSLKLPSEWKDQSIYRYEGPEDDGIKHQILVTVEKDVELESLERYAEMQIKGMENELQAYRELKKGLIQLRNGAPAYEVVYQWNPVKGREMYQRVVFCLLRKTGYILTSTFSKKTWKIRGAEVDKILMSFSVS